MSWQSVMRDDLLDLRRSRLGIGVALLMIVYTGGIGFLVFLADFTQPADASPFPFDLIMLTIGSLLSFLLPVVAMLASYSAIIHERETGSIRFLLGLPNSRLDAYTGKYLSRSILYVASTVVGFLALGVIAFAILGDPAPTEFALFLLATLLYGLVFIGFGLAISAVLDSEIAVTVGVFSIFGIFRGGWLIVQWAGLYLTRPQGEVGRRPYPDWYYFLGRFNPINAYVKIVDQFFNQGPHVILTNPQPAVNTIATGTAYAAFALVFWLVVVPVGGYVLFDRKDVL